MVETRRVCDHCGAPLRGLIDGYCPYCRTRPFVAGADGTPAPVAPSGLHTVLLLDAGRNKIGVIKELREVVEREFQVDLGLAEAKDLVDRASTSSPPALVVDVDDAAAQRWADAFARAGAQVAVVPPVGPSPSPASAAAPPAAGVTDASTSGTFDVVLTATGRNAIAVIKAVRELTGLGLKEAKDLVDLAGRQPQAVLGGLDQATATAHAQRLAAAGATAEVRTA